MKIKKLILQLSLVLSTLTPAASHAELQWGINGHPYSAYPGVSIQQQLDKVKDLGMTSYRVNLSSSTTPAILKKLVDEAKLRGITILPILQSGNLSGQSEAVLYQNAYNLAFQWVSALKNDIRVWELGNEMENYAIIQPCEMRDDGTQYPCAWGPAGGVGVLEYYGPRWRKVSAVLKGLSEGVMAADPTAKKAIGTAGWGHVGAFERMKLDGIQWDISVWHMYGEDPEWAFKKLVTYKKPIWVTEFNHPSGSMKDGEDAQAKGLVFWMNRLRALQATYNIQAAHAYELLDESYWTGFEAYMGLIHIQKNASGAWSLGTEKPAYTAVKNSIISPMIPLMDLSKLTFSPMADQSPAGQGSSGLIDNGYGVRILGNHWVKAPLNYTITSKTVVEFDMVAPQYGEIYGIGLRPTNGSVDTYTFNIVGSQMTGIQTYHQSVTGNIHVKIEFSKFPKLQKKINEIYFVSDNDKIPSDGDVSYKNLKIYEEGTIPVMDLSKLTLSAIADQSPAGQGSSALVDNGNGIQITGNRWIKALFNYTITSKTVLEFDIQATKMAEIYGVGLRPTNGSVDTYTFNIAGSQLTGIQTYRQTVNGTVHIKIEFSRFPSLQKKVNELYFVSDSDAVPTDGSVIYKNIRIYENP